MKNLILDTASEGLARIVAPQADGKPVIFATVYLMKDGWHAKLASEHTRHAWSGPFDSAEAAYQALVPLASRPDERTHLAASA